MINADTEKLLQRAMEALRACIHQDKGWATTAHEVANEIEANLKDPAVLDGTQT